MTSSIDSEDPSRWCKIFVRGEAGRQAVLVVVANVLNAEVDGWSVANRVLSLEVRGNDEFDAARAGDFLFWPFLVEVQGETGVERFEIVAGVRDLLEGLWIAAFDAVAACDFEDELPFRGGIGRETPVELPLFLLRPEAVPPEFRYLVPAAGEWGIGDDGLRDEKVKGADEESLRRLLALVDEAPDELWSWLVGPDADSEWPSAEYIALTCLTMAADLARLRLRGP